MTRLRLAADPPSSRDLFDAAFSFNAALSVLERIKLNYIEGTEARWELSRDLGNLDALLIGCYSRLRKRPGISPENMAMNDELIVKSTDLAQPVRCLLVWLVIVRICLPTCRPT